MSWNSFINGINTGSDSIGSLAQTISESIEKTSDSVKSFELPTIQTTSTFSPTPMTWAGIAGLILLIFVLVKRK